VPLNFIVNGFTNLEKEIKQQIKKKYEADLKNVGIFKRFKIRRNMKYEIAIELLKKCKEISHESLFLKK
jgi:hypothetical protein